MVGETTWIHRSIASDLAIPVASEFLDEMNLVTAASSTIGITVAASTTVVGYAYTELGAFTNEQWEPGDWTIEVNITSADMAIEIAVRPVKVGMFGGTIPPIPSFSAEQNAGSTGVLSFGPTNYTWNSTNHNDRIRIDYQFRNTNTHSSKSVTIDRNTTNDEVITPVLLSNAERAQFFIARKRRRQALRRR